MSEFEDFIKAKYPVDYESLKEKYPNVPVVEFYGDELDVWNHQQSKITQLKAEKEAVLELAKQWQETARQLSITDDKHVICSLLSCAEEVEKALRGGHE